MIGPASPSGSKSASAQITTRPSFLHAVDLSPPSTGVATLKIYDSEDATTSGRTIILEATCAAGQNSIYINCLVPRICNRGIYAVLTGTTTYTVGFSLG